MTRKATLPKITECIDPMPRGSSFSDTRMIEALAAFVVLGILCLAHIHLQFLRTDMRFQQRELQKRVSDLQQQQLQLSRANENLCGRQRLEGIARASHMREVEPGRQQVAMVSLALQKKYSEPLREVQPAETALASLESRKVRMTDRVLSFLDVSKAYAGAVLPER